MVRSKWGPLHLSKSHLDGQRNSLTPQDTASVGAPTLTEGGNRRLTQGGDVTYKLRIARPVWSESLVTKINPQRIDGPWFEGFVLDIHTVSSQPVGVGPSGHTLFDTTYSEIGLLLYKLKYQRDASSAPAIIEAAAKFWEPARSAIDLIVPVPASSFRVVQPVEQLAAGLGAAMNIPVAQCISTTRPPSSLKDVTDPEKRKELLNGLHTVDTEKTTGKRILLVDDLYRSGSTMHAVAEVLTDIGKAASVRAFAITRTRRNR